MDSSVNISAVVITFNEERNLGRCLDSLKTVADEIIVVDSFSTDRTEEISRAKNAVFIQHSFVGHVEQKNYAVSCASYDIILSLDADEVLSDELTQSILAAKGNWKSDGYIFNRLTSYCGKWIRHCGWYPDAKLRLWDRRKGRWGGINPHDRVIMKNGCRTRHLNGDLLHYSYPTIRHHLSQMNNFSDIASLAAFESVRRVNFLVDILLNPMLTFLKKYFLKLGILDGCEGFFISIHTAYGKFLKYTQLRELNRLERPPKSSSTKK